MPKIEIYWDWEEAFDKFGFGDGDGLVMTHEVAEVIEELDYEVEYNCLGMHNTVIDSIKKDGKEVIPESVQTGYDNPRDYLPKDIVEHLDKTYDSSKEKSGWVM